MKFNKTLLAAALMLAATAAQAGGFVELPTSGTLRKTGAANQNTDQFFIAEGAKIGELASDPSINLYAPPANFTLLASRETEVELSGVEVGTFYDYVFRDTNDNKLVFGSRVFLDADAEINDIFRSGFSGFSAAVAWTRTSDADLRLYSASRTATGLKQGADVFDADVIDLRSDINEEEGNPGSGLYLIKTNALYYTLSDDVVRLRQAGEEGQPIVADIFAGFAPTNTAPIPEPSTYAMLLGGLGLLGAVAKRRRSA